MTYHKGLFKEFSSHDIEMIWVWRSSTQIETHDGVNSSIVPYLRTASLEIVLYLPSGIDPAWGQKRCQRCRQCPGRHGWCCWCGWPRCRKQSGSRFCQHQPRRGLAEVKSWSFYGSFTTLDRVPFRAFLTISPLNVKVAQAVLCHYICCENYEMMKL